MLVVIHSNLFYSTQQETLVHSNPEFSLGLKWMFIWLQFGSLPAITDLASDSTENSWGSYKPQSL